MTAGGPRRIGKLRVQVLGAHDLVGKDRNGKSDPFVILNLPDAPPPPSSPTNSSSKRDKDFYRRRTPVQPKTLDPTWKENEATFEWDITTDWFPPSVGANTANLSGDEQQVIVTGGDSDGGRLAVAPASAKPVNSTETPQATPSVSLLAPHGATEARPNRPSNARKISTATGKLLTAPVRITTKGAVATSRAVRRRAGGPPRPMRLRRGQPPAHGGAPAGSAALASSRGSQNSESATGSLSVIEFVAWDKDKWSGNDYLGEVTLHVTDWVTKGKSAHWASTEPIALPLRSSRRNTKVGGELIVRIGIISTGDEETADDILVRLLEASARNENAGIRSVPADQSVGMSGPTDAFLDDGLSSESDSEAREELMTEDEHSAADDTDREATDGIISMSETEDDSENDVHFRYGQRYGAQPAREIGQPIITVDDENVAASDDEADGHVAAPPSRRTLVSRLRKTGSFITGAGRSREGGASALSSHPQSGTVSDAGDEGLSSATGADVQPERRQRLRVKARVPRRRPRRQTTASTNGDATDDVSPSGKASRRQRRREAQRRRQDFSLKASLGMDIIGIVQMEVKGATDLPRWRNSLGTSFDMDAFAIVSFGQRIFRTRVARHSLNPVWDEKLLFHVRRHESNYLTKLAVYDWDKLSANDFVGECDLHVQDLIEAAPKPNPDTGLYAEEDESTHDMQKITLSLQRTERAEEGKTTQGKHDSKLHLEARFMPYAALRQRFWRQLLRQYDSDDSGSLSVLEFTSMLDSLGSTLTTHTIEALFEQYGQHAGGKDVGAEGDVELTIDEAIIALEAEIMKPFSQKRVVQRSERAMSGHDMDGSSGLQTPAESALGNVDGILPHLTGADYVGPQAPQAGDEEDLAAARAPVPMAAVDGPVSTGRFIRELRHDDSKASLGSSTSAQSSSASFLGGAIGREPIRASSTQSSAGEKSAGDADNLATAVQNVDEGQVERVIVLRSCPLCRMPRLSKKAEVDIVTHLAVCASQDWRRVDSMVVGNYVTAMQAHRKWMTRVISKISQGQYQLGANSANIIVQDRMTGQLLEEKMQAYVRLGIRLLYKGARSRMEGARIKRMLKNMSVKQGAKYDSPVSAREIAHFVAFHSLNVDEIRDPLDSFKTFNEFFYRRLKEDARPVDDAADPNTLVSGADCRLMVFPSVTEATQIWIKGRGFTIEKLLGEGFLPRKNKSATWAKELDTYREGGAFSIFRLAPQDYHRFHCPCDCVVGAVTVIEGQYYTVNPMAIRSTIDVYCENVRVIVPLISKEFGVIYYTCIGAMMVGSTVLTVKEGDRLARGDEIGFFKFGGSTICMCFPENSVVFDDDLLTNSGRAIETLVRVGMRLGRTTTSATRDQEGEGEGAPAEAPASASS